MATEQNQLIDAIAKLIKLTQENVLKWDLGTAPDLANTEGRRVESVYLAEYKGQKLRLIRQQLRVRAAWSFIAAPPSKEPTYTWTTTYLLQFLSAEGRATWTFPQNESLKDLYTAVQYQVAGVNDFLDKLLKED